MGDFAKGWNDWKKAMREWRIAKKTGGVGAAKKAEQPIKEAADKILRSDISDDDDKAAEKQMEDAGL